MRRLWLLAFLALGLAALAYSRLSAQQWLPGSPAVPIACAYSTSPPTVTTGQFVLVQCNNQGQLLGTGGGGGGGSVTQGTVPWVDDVTQWANVALGSPSNYGTSPGAVEVPGVNAFITNSPSIANTSFGISGTLPAFASTPTFNCGTGCGGGSGGAITAASGSYAAGAFSIGSAVDGWDLSVQTTTASAGCGSGTGVNPCLKQIDADVKGPITSQSSTVPIGGMSICDGANGATNPCTTAATVKAASTLPAAADKSLVVGLNPGTATAGSPTGAILTVQGISGGTTLPVSSSGAVNQTLTDCSGTITTGGTAQNAFTAQTTLHGFTIMNIDTTEPLWISFTTTAAASGSASYPLQAATATTFANPGSFTSAGGMGTNHALSVIAATTSHKWSCTWW
jgi:hypothetical protein